MKGILVINKKEGYTSRDVVNVIGKKLNTKKVGHTGTLDPLATGVLVVCVGRYTKLVDRLTALDKEYIAEIKLGISTDTLDITGNVLDSKKFYLTKEDILKVLGNFVGEYKMQVPLFSAIKVKGKRLYEYARKNEEVSLPIKIVHIYKLELLSFEGDIIKIKAHVSKGTYIRSLIKDICERLNVLGTMNSLVRVKQGCFSLENAIDLENVTSNNLLELTDFLEIEKYYLNSEEYMKVKNGNKVQITSNEKELLLIYNEEEIAIYIKDQDCYKCEVMLEV